MLAWLPWPPDQETPAILIGFSPALTRPSGSSTWPPTTATSAASTAPQPLQAVARRHRVGVEEEQPFAAGLARGEVDGAGIAKVCAGMQDPRGGGIGSAASARAVAPPGSLSTTSTSIGASD